MGQPEKPQTKMQYGACEFYAE